MKRGVRRLLRLLDRAPNAVEDVMRHAERWKRLAEVLHPGDYADKYPRALAAITAAARRRAGSFGSRVETLLAQRHIATLTPLLQQRPGEFARRLDVTLRRSTDPTPCWTHSNGGGASVHADPAAGAGPDPAPAPALRSLHAQGRTGQGLRHPDRREPLRPKCWRARPDLPRRARQALASLPPLGRSFVDPAARHRAAGAARRIEVIAYAGARQSPAAAGHALHPPVPVVEERRARTDIDLSAAFFDANFVFMQTVAYYNLKGFGGYHSGDIVDAPQGASEFIDLDIDALVEKGIRYVVTSINSYTRQPYCDLPECFAGWMARADLASGEVYEPRTVVDRIDIASDTQICLPFVMDLQERRVTWADLGLTSTPRWNNVRNNLSGVSLMLRALVHTPRPDLETLFDLHARARGERVKTRQEAQAVFAPHEGVTPFDVDKIRSAFL